MKAEWKSINFELVEYKDSKCPVLKYIEYYIIIIIIIIALLMINLMRI